jgi:hypothetical protein
MFPLADMVHLLSHEFASLSAGRFPFPCILTSPLDNFFLWHSFSFMAQLVMRDSAALVRLRDVRLPQDLPAPHHR